MSIFYENLESLGRKNSELAEKIGNISETSLPIFHSGNHSAELEISFIQRPDQKFLENFAANPGANIFPHTRLVIFMGFGAGATFNSYFSELKERGEKIEALVVEKDPALFSLALHVCDWREAIANPRFHFWIGMNETELRRALMDFFVRTGRANFINAIQVIAHPDLVRFDHTYYRRFEQIANEVIHYAARLYGDSCEDCFKGFENLYQNLDLICKTPYLGVFKDCFKGIPAIVCASGPSLEKSFETLRECQDRAILLAADSALKPLLKEGIRPHFVVSIERDDIIPDFYQNCGDANLSDIGLVACSVVIPPVFQVFQGPKIATFRNYEYMSPFVPREELKSIGPTCGNMAFNVARRFGCFPILLVGQDLAYASSDYRSHVRGTVMTERDQSNRLDELLRRGFFFVPGNQGGEVLTEPGFATALFGYEKALIEDPIDCINCGFGARIRGTRTKSLEECLNSELKEVNPKLRSTVLKVLKERADEFQTKSGYLAKFKEQLPQILCELQNILAKSRAHSASLFEVSHLPAHSANLRQAVIDAEAWYVSLQNENMTFRTFISPVMTPLLASFQRRINGLATTAKDDNHFFREVVGLYDGILDKIALWTSKVHDVMAKA